MHQRFFSTQFRTNQLYCPTDAKVQHLKGSPHLAVSKSSSCKEFIMSARNGDKSRFNRERKQKIARRKRTHELLERVAKARKSAVTTGRAEPRSVSA